MKNTPKMVENGHFRPKTHREKYPLKTGGCGDDRIQYLAPPPPPKMAKIQHDPVHIFSSEIPHVLA